MQEVAWWRTGDCGITSAPRAGDNHQDYLGLLLDRLNRHRARYRVVAVQPELDFEAPGNLDGDQHTGVTVLPGVLGGCEANVRLTMRDVVLAKAGVATGAPTGGHSRTSSTRRSAASR